MVQKKKKKKPKRRDDAQHGGRRGEGRWRGEPLADELLQFLPFEVQYFHLLPSMVDAPVAGAELGISSNSQSIPAHCHSPSPEIPSMRAGGLQDASSDGQCRCWVLIYT